MVSLKSFILRISALLEYTVRLGSSHGMSSLDSVCLAGQLDACPQASLAGVRAGKKPCRALLLDSKAAVCRPPQCALLQAGLRVRKDGPPHGFVETHSPDTGISKGVIDYTRQSSLYLQGKAGME